MTTRVEIRVGELADSLVVPISAVAENKGKHCCYVVQAQRIERRSVTVGANTERYVEITGGLTEGEQVALDARYRAAAELEGQADSPTIVQPTTSDAVAALR
jgi:hypothetical protein